MITPSDILEFILDEHRILVIVVLLHQTMHSLLLPDGPQRTIQILVVGILPIHYFLC